jgi:hypothetical protein
MILFLDESTAARRRVPVALVDDTDGKTAETGITLSAGDMKISKNGGAQANHAGTLTELAGGDYYYEFAAAELDTVGYVTGKIVKSGCRTFRIFAQVVSYNPYSATSGLLDVNAAYVGSIDADDPVGALPLHGIVDSGTAQSVTSTTLVRRSGGPTFETNLLAGHQCLVWSATTGKLQVNSVLTNTTDTLTFADSWTITPTGTIKYVIFATAPASTTNPTPVRVLTMDSGTVTDAAFATSTGLKNIRSGTAQAGAAGTITLDASASSLDDFYNNQMIAIESGTGVGQARFVSDYAGATKVVTVSSNWVTNPDNTSVFAIRKFGVAPGGIDGPGVRTAVGLASANLDTQLTAIDDYLDTEVAAIKAKTDNLPAAPAATGDIPTAVQNADALLTRHIAGGSNVSGLDARSVTNALRLLRNKASISAGVLTVKQEDDSTTAWTAAVSTAAGDPISGIDPT